jgi:hypothetical protein
VATFEEIGDNLFGRSLRLFVAHWILSQDGRQFFQMELVSACGRYSTNALKPLKELISIGMVEELPSHVPGQRRKYYKQQTNALWEAVAIAVRASGRNPLAEPRMNIGTADDNRQRTKKAMGRRRAGRGVSR